MAKYLKKFETTSKYYEYIYDNPELPNVSICADDESTVYYNPIDRPLPTLYELNYTSSDDKVVNVSAGPQPVINTYVEGEGVMKFKDPITEISENAFEGTNLKTIEIPEDVNNIGGCAFKGCANLESLYIPENVTSINWGTFWDCTSLTDVFIPDGVTRIGFSAFQNCASLTTVEIPESVTSIEYGAFLDCMGLTGITCLPTIPPTIEALVFESTNFCPIFVPADSVDAYKAAWVDYASRIQAIPVQPTDEIWYTSNDGNIVNPFDSSVFGANIISNTYQDGKGVIKFDGPVTSIGNMAFFLCSGLISITIPDSVTTIGDMAIDVCYRLTSINIPDSVTSIGNQAFQSCGSLTDITIPDSVTSIGEQAFYGCSGLESITVNNNNTVYDSRNNCNALIETSTNKLIQGCKNTIIPSTVTSIGDSAFDNCTQLTGITIPDSVTSIGNSAFNGCTSLPLITIPDSVTSIGNSAFYNCYNLPSITIPDSVTSIGGNAFVSCYGLESITVNNSNTVYDSRNNCNAIIETNTNKLIAGCKNTIIPNTVTSINNWVFYNCSGLTSITIPDSVTEIGEGTFESCTSLTDMTIPDSVTYIRNRAFFNCANLTGITVEATTPTSLGGSAFDYTNDCPIYVPEESVDAYKAADGWSYYADRITAIV